MNNVLFHEVTQVHTNLGYCGFKCILRNNDKMHLYKLTRYLMFNLLKGRMSLSLRVRLP